MCGGMLLPCCHYHFMRHYGLVLDRPVDAFLPVQRFPLTRSSDRFAHQSRPTSRPSVQALPVVATLAPQYSACSLRNLANEVLIGSSCSYIKYNAVCRSNPRDPQSSEHCQVPNHNSYNQQNKTQHQRNIKYLSGFLPVARFQLLVLIIAAMEGYFL